MSKFNRRTLPRTLYAVCVLTFIIGCRPKSSDDPSDTSQPPQKPAQAAPTAVVYLLDNERGKLHAVRVPLETPEDADISAKARYVLTHYVSFTPSQKELEKPFPPGTKLLDLQIKDRVAAVNLSEEYRTQKWWGGTDHAYLALRALVNTLTEWKGIEKVQILIEGKKPAEKDCGGVETWEEPLERDESLIEESS